MDQEVLFLVCGVLSTLAPKRDEFIAAAILLLEYPEGNLCALPPHCFYTFYSALISREKHLSVLAQAYR